MDRLRAMRVFVEVAAEGGFAGAARRLAMSPPAVTRAIGSLEDALGTRLLRRTTRSVKLTEPGARYLEDCRRILAAIDEAEASAAGLHGTPSGTLTVTSSVLFGQYYVLPILEEFLDRHAAVSARALLLDRVTQLVDEGIDVAIRIGQLPDSGYNAVRVGSVRSLICGAPAYFERYGIPETPADLSRHRIVVATGADAALDWRFGGHWPVVRIKPRLSCTTNGAAISAAERGWGLTRVLSYQIGPALLDGRLQTVLSAFETEPVPIHVLHPEGRTASAKVRRFVDLAIERLRTNPIIAAAETR